MEETTMCTKTTTAFCEAIENLAICPFELKSMLDHLKAWVIDNLAENPDNETVIELTGWIANAAQMQQEIEHVTG